MTSKAQAAEVMALDENQAILTEYFIGTVSGEYYDGNSHQLYLDLDDDTLSIYTEASGNSWLQRDDLSLIQIAETSGSDDGLSADERYTDDCDINDYGYIHWLDMIEDKIAERIEYAQPRS